MLKLLIYSCIFFNLFDCNKTNEEFCDENFVDSILFDGREYLVTRNDMLFNLKTAENMNINSFIWEYKEQLTENHTYYQSMFYLTFNFEANCDRFANQTVQYYCSVLSSNNNTIFAFLYEDINGKQTIGKFEKRALKYPLFKTYDSCDDNAFPEDFDFPNYTRCPNQTHKPSTYWPNKHLLILVFNTIETLNANKAIIAIRNLTVIGFGKQWVYHEIEGSEHKRYIALFWWHKTDSVFAVIEDKTKSKRIGFVYSFDQNIPNKPFIPTNQTITEFFGCNRSDTLMTSMNSTINSDKPITTAQPTNDNKTLLILFLSIVLIVIVLISIVIIIAIYYISSSKRENTSLSIKSDVQSLADTTSTTIYTINSETGQRVEK